MDIVGNNWEYEHGEMIFLDIPHILVIYIVRYTVIYTVIPDIE